VLHREINVMEPDGQIIASTDASRIGHIHTGARRIAAEQLAELAIYPGDETEGTRPGINLPINVGGELTGVIGITGAPEELLVPGEVIKKMTELMVLNLQREQKENALAHARRTFYEYLLFSDSVRPEEVKDRAHAVGVDLKPKKALVLLETVNVNLQGTAADRVRSWTAGRRGDFCFESRGRMVLILIAATPKEAVRRTEEMLATLPADLRGELRCGISGCTADPGALAQHYRRARTALETARSAGSSEPLFYDEASLAFLLKSIPAELRRSLGDTLFRNTGAEERSRAEETIRLYFACGGDIDKAAERVFVHRNTMYYRVRQVQAITGKSLLVPEEAFLLYLAVNGEEARV